MTNEQPSEERIEELKKDPYFNDLSAAQRASNDYSSVLVNLVFDLHERVLKLEGDKK